MTHPLRSVLFLPASNLRAVGKARSLACDVVVLDLEDAVGPEDKQAGRTAMLDAVAAGGFGDRMVVVRVNGLDTPWGEEDLIAAAAAGPDAILVPKVSSAEELTTYEQAIASAPERTRLWTMIETCRAILNLGEIAEAGAVTRLTALVLGVNDLSKDMHARQVAGREPLLAAMALTVTAARAHGLAALDGVFNDLSDAPGFAAECLQGRNFGFDGKSLIHPDQIAAANSGFSPDVNEIAWAEAVIAAFADPANADKGVLRVGGKMVERLHLEEARQVLLLAGAAL